MTSGDFPKDDKSLRNDSDGRQQRDFDDLQNELAGRDAGRISRFFNDRRRGSATERQRKQSDTAQLLTNLQILMQDAEYAAVQPQIYVPIFARVSGTGGRMFRA